jgi:phage terminase Nu1 subunit (DNA packaging protein)
MTAELPDYYFRVRENGAAVFRISTENRQRRIEMDEIAAVNVKNGTIKPHGDVTLAKADLAAIESWLAERQAQLAAREVDDILRAIDHLNLTTQWAQSRATDGQLEAVTDRLLLTMHDLRTVLVRKKADRLGKSE